MSVKRETVTGPMLETLTRGLRAIVLAPILLYQRFVSPLLPRRCKYHPTCSAYAVDAIRELGVMRGTILAAWRLLRCNPFSNGGYDPVEDRTLFRRAGSTREAQPRSNWTRERGRERTGYGSAAERERRIGAELGSSGSGKGAREAGTSPT